MTSETTNFTASLIGGCVSWLTSRVQVMVVSHCLPIKRPKPSLLSMVEEEDADVGPIKDPQQMRVQETHNKFTRTNTHSSNGALHNTLTT